MPGNEVQDRLHSLYELSNSSSGLTTSQRVDGDRPVFNYKHQGNSSQFVQVPFDQTFAQSNPRPEFSRHISRSNLLNSNGYTHGHQNFQRWQNQGLYSDENTETGWRNSTSASADSPTLTTNSEKSEVAEASSDFNVLGWQQQLVRGQELSSSQTPSMQQSGFNDVQMLQQNLMFKQMQELQRKQQLQQLGKQAAGGQLPLLINGTPVRDSSSQVFMNMMQRSSSPSGQGVPHIMAFSQDPNQSMPSTGLVSQKPRVSLHGTPVGSAGGVVNQYAHMQGMSRGWENSLNKAGSGNQSQSTFGNPFPVDHDTFSSNNVCMPQGGFALKQGFPMKDAFGQVSPQHGNILHTNASLPGFNLETMQQKTTQLPPSQGLIPLDPLEQKFLYNMDDDSYGRNMDLDAGGFGGALELQSGSWSALMQTAVAEASSCETGAQEEWSGLTFQSTELSTDNQPSKFMGEERQQPSWADSTLQNASSNSKPHLMLNDPSISSSFPGFQQSGFQSSNEHGESLHQRKSSNQMSQEIQPQTHLVNAWAGRNGEHPESYLHGMTLHNKVNQLYDKQKGDGDDVNLAMDKRRDLDGYSWTEQMEQLSSCTNKHTSKREVSQVNHFAAAPNVSTGKAHLPDRKATYQHEYMKRVGFFMNNNENESGGETRHLPMSRNKTINNSYEGANTAYKNFNAGLQQGDVVNSIVIDDMSKNAMNPNQGFLSEFHGNSKASEQTVLRGDIRSSSSTKFGQTFESYGQNVASRTSQHMLELLHKVDRSRENSPMAHFSTTVPTSLSESPKIDAYDSHTAQMLNRSSASQGFGLKLAPPSQRLTKSSCFLPQDSSPLVQSFPPNEFSQRAHWGEKSSSSGQTNAFSNLNMPHVRSQLQTQHMNALVSGESSRATLTDTYSRFPPFSPCSQDTPRQISQPMSTRLQNTWENVPASQCMETTSLASPKGGTVSSDLGDCSTNAQGSDYGEQPGIHMFRQEMSSEIIDTLQSGGLYNSSQQEPDRVVYSDNHASAASERNLESLGCSSRASETLHQNYTLLGQVHAMRSSAETDPSRTATRRYNEAYSVANIQQISDIAGQQSIYEPNSRFSNQTLAGPDLSRVNQAFDQIELQNQIRGAVYNHSENPHVNLHMAPTWFKPYDTFRNVHVQPMYDARLAKTAMDQRGIALPEQGGNISPSTTGRADGTVSALHVLSLDLVNRIRPSVGSKKRKSIGSEHIPWHKEVTQGSDRLQDISTAEQDWAYATNHLTEKVEDDFELIGEDQPMHQRSKRRMTRTTQLMQQLFRPAPASVLLGDASSRYDSVTYLIAKVALGDACSLAHGSKKDCHAAQGDNNTISEKPESFESDEHFTKVVEDFTDRVKKLEDNFSRLESASLLDIRLDCEDLERYSVMNRFAKFHMRGQAATSGTSSSATTMSPPKSSPQRWVTALPLPRNLPEDTQCISL